MLRQTKSFSNFELFSLKNIIRDGNKNLLENLILQDYFNINVKDEHGNTMLNYAIMNNNIEICHLLIKYKIDMNTVNCFHMTPLQESIHMKTENITKLLRDSGAYFKNKLDSEQIIFGIRDEFFDKLKLFIEFTSYQNPHFKTIQFFHNTYNSPFMFSCSIDKNIDENLNNYISNLILSKENVIFREKIINVKNFKNQNDFFLLPYCTLFDIEQIQIVPLTIDKKLLGYFLIFNEKESEYYNYQQLFLSVLNNNYFFKIPSVSTYKRVMYCDIMKRKMKQISKILESKDSNYNILISLSKWILELKEFSNELKDDILFQQLIQYISYYEYAFIPFGHCSKIYKLLSDVKKQLDIQYTPSFSFVWKLLLQLKHDNTNLPQSFILENCKDFDSRDYYNIIGKSLSNTQIENLNNIYQNFEIKKEILVDIVSILLEKNISFRDSHVLGIKNKFENTFFLFPTEIEKGLDFVFENYKNFENPIYQFYYLYHTISSYIHPFQDGNGRTSRVFLNFCLRKYGISKILSRTNKLISWESFCKIF